MTMNREANGMDDKTLDCYREGQRQHGDVSMYTAFSECGHLSRRPHLTALTKAV